MTTSPLSLRHSAPAVVALALVFVPGVLAFGPVFNGPQGWIAAGGGVLIGLAVGLVASWRRWALASTVAAVVIAHLALGGPFALPRTTIAGVLPTLDTFVRLVPLSVQAWRDLLTVAPPADSFIGPAVVPWLSGLVLGTVGALLVVRANRHLWALVPPLALLLVGILWGLGESPWAPWLGIAFAAAGLAFAVWRTSQERGRTADEILTDGATSAGRRTAGATAVAVILAGAVVAGAASPLLAVGADRHVLRDHVRPPLTLQDYASPLASYRWYEVDMKDVTLFTVTGLGAGERLRLASLDAYDGMVYNVTDDSAGFVRIGDTLHRSASSGTPSPLEVAVEAYSGPWVPGGGQVWNVRFTGDRRDALADGLHYNDWGGTLLTTAGLTEGDRFAIQAASPLNDRAAAVGRPLADAPVPSNERVPDVVGSTALEIVGDASTPLDQVERLERALREGFYSDGSDGVSRAGHTAERISSMLTAPVLIGDDEQYAVAMALMARALGIPARVVLGFYPTDEATAASPLAVTGTMAHVWVEVPFDGVGWVAFDPTPDRDRVPQTEVPKPKPQPRPQVITLPEPPPNTSVDPFDDPGLGEDPEQEDGWSAVLAILRQVGLVTLVGALIASPFVTIGVLKSRRRRRRSTDPDLVARSAGGWAELEDVALDLGTRLPTTYTRQEAAGVLSAAHPAAGADALASAVDHAVFAPVRPTVGQADAIWAGTDAALATLRADAGRWRRVRGFCSIRSLTRGLTPPDPRSLVARLGRPARKEAS